MERNERETWNAYYQTALLMGRIWYPYWAVGFDPTNP
jgi:hypothetical protein